MRDTTRRLLCTHTNITVPAWQSARKHYKQTPNNCQRSVAAWQQCVILVCVWGGFGGWLTDCYTTWEASDMLKKASVLPECMHDFTLTQLPQQLTSNFSFTMTHAWHHSLKMQSCLQANVSHTPPPTPAPNSVFIPQGCDGVFKNFKGNFNVQSSFRLLTASIHHLTITINNIVTLLSYCCFPW